MDAFPEEKLNRRFREIIKNNRKYVKFPKIFLTIAPDKTQKENKPLKKIKLTLNGSNCVINCSNWNSISFLDTGDSFTEIFFKPFVTRKDVSRSIFGSIFPFRRNQRHSLQSLLDFIFGRADIILYVNRIVCPKWTQLITETVQNKRNRIINIEVELPQIQHLTFHENSYFKMAQGYYRGLNTAEHERFCTMASMFQSISLFYVSGERINVNNELEASLKNIEIGVLSVHSSIIMYFLVKGWKEVNCPKAFYKIHKYSNQSAFEREFLRIEYFHQNFRFEPLKYVNDLKKAEVLAFRFVDKESGKSLILEKTAREENDIYVLNKWKIYIVSIRTEFQ